jgi:hypothetical protein
MIGIAGKARSGRDPFAGARVDGFRESLSTGQGSDLYRHVFGFAGTVLAYRSGGLLVAAGVMAQDLKQLWDRKSGARGEVNDNIAGLKVGAAMLVGSLHGNNQLTQRWISGTLCE